MSMGIQAREDQQTARHFFKALCGVIKYHATGITTSTEVAEHAQGV